MSRRVNESARVLNFFRSADLGKAEVLYDLVRETMDQRLAPAKAAKKAMAKKRQPKAATLMTDAQGKQLDRAGVAD